MNATDVSAQCAPLAPDCDNDGVCDSLDICPNLNDALVGTACDDGDACTTNDVWTTACDCEGVLLADDDQDGICNSNDQCPDFDDEMDIDKDGIPYCLDNCIDVNENGICDDIDSDPFPQDLKVHFSHKRGFYNNTFQLELIANIPNTTIRYEVGVNPICPSVSSGTIYSGAISVLDNGTLQTIKVIATNGTQSTKVYTHSFIFLTDDHPTVVLSQSPYAVAAGETEDVASFEFIVNQGSKLKSVQEYCGTKISSGGVSAGQSDKVFFRSAYDAGTLKADLFSDHYYGLKPVEKIDQLFLRGEHNDDTHLRQLVAHDAMRASGEFSPAGRYVQFIKFADSVEIRHLQERPEGGFMESYTGIDKQNFEAITSHHYAPPLSAAYNSLIGNATNWPLIKNNINMNSLSSFMINAWIANVIDYWEDHNFRAAGPANLALSDGADNSWHFFNWDLDVGYGRVYISGNNTVWPSVDTAWSSPWSIKTPFLSPEFILPVLNNHDEFRLLFADQIHCHMKNDGAYTDSNYLERIWTRTDQLTSFGKDRYYWSNQMDTWIPRKLNWLFGELQSHDYYPDLDQVEFSHKEGVYPTAINLSLSNTNTTGSIYYSLDGSDVRTETGGLSTNAILYSSSINLPKGVHEVVARVYDPSQSDLVDKWSAFCCAKVYYINQSYENIVINEVHYDPNDSIYFNPLLSQLDTVDGKNFEFIELKNTGLDTVYLDGISFTKGVDLTVGRNFPLAPGAFAVFAEDSSWFHEKYGFAPDGVYSGQLDNGGEKITLKNPKLYLIDTVRYDDKNGWPSEPDQGVVSLGLKLPSIIDNGNEDNWSVQSIAYTPKAENIFDPNHAFHPLQINEIQYHTTDSINGAVVIDDDEFEFIEIKNTSNAPVDISHYFFSRGIEYRFPLNTIISANGFLVIARDSMLFHARYGQAADGIYDGKLKNSGEDIWLHDIAGNLIDAVNYDDSAPWTEDADGTGFSLALYRDSLQNEIASNWNTQCYHVTPWSDNKIKTQIQIVSNQEEICAIDSLDLNNFVDPMNSSGSWFLNGQSKNFANDSGDYVYIFTNTSGCSSTDTLTISHRIPDYVSTLAIAPSAIVGLTQVRTIINISEVKNKLACSPVYVLMPKDVSRFNFTYLPNALAIGGLSVDNSEWQYYGTNPSFHLWQFIGDFPAVGTKKIGFIGSYNPNNTDGATTFTVQLFGGSGGEDNSLNNSDSESLIYFK